MYYCITLIPITTVNEWQAKDKRSQRSDVILKSYQKTASIIIGTCKSFSGASSQKNAKLYDNRPGEQINI